MAFLTASKSALFRYLLATFCVVTIVAICPSTASAHDGTIGGDSNFQVTVNDTTPTPEITVQVVQNSHFLELSYTGSTSIEILGYFGEPYAEIRTDGAYINSQSPTFYQNQDIIAPDSATAFTPPLWKKIGDKPIFTWHDHRASWASSNPPPAIVANPSRHTRISDWTIPLRSGTERIAISGRLDWVPPPPTSTWHAGLVLLTTAIASAIIATHRHSIARTLAVTGALVAGSLAIIDVIGRAIIATDEQRGFWENIATTQLWQFTAAVCLVSAASYSVLRRVEGIFAVALPASAIAFIFGLSRFDVFSSALTATPWSSWWAHTSTLVIIGTATGIALAGFSEIRRTSSTQAIL